MPNNQTKLNPELENWFNARQKALNIVHTTTTPAGRTIDWVPIESQVGSGKIGSPPLAAKPAIAAPHAAEKVVNQVAKTRNL